MVDAHVHLYPPEVNRAPAEWAAGVGEGLWAQLCTRRRKDGRAVQGFPSVDELLRAMDEAGIRRAILQGWYWEKAESCRGQNRFYAECMRAHPERLSACAALHPTMGIEGVREEIAWAVEHGFVGLGELSPHSQGVSIADPAWRAALASAADCRLPVVLHVTDPASRPYSGRVETPLGDFVRMAGEFSRTTFVLAHWGARLPLRPEGAGLHGAGNVFYDTAASPLLYGSEVFKEMVGAVGVEHIVFGSDFPLVLYPRSEAGATIAGFVVEAAGAGLSTEQRGAVMGANAERIFAKAT